MSWFVQRVLVVFYISSINWTAEEKVRMHVPGLRAMCTDETN